MKKIVIAVLVLVVVLVCAYFAINRIPYAPEMDAQNPERITLTGTYLCLPLRDTTHSDTDCTAGIQSEDGAYYAVDFGFYTQGMPQVVEGDVLTAEGVITPIETLSTDYWQKYPVVGIFSVTASLRIEPQKVEPAAASTTLTSVPWVWKKSAREDGSVVEAKEGMFVLSFAPDLSYQSTTDCNALRGTYTVEGEVLHLAQPMMTQMYCEGSIETDYVSQLMLTEAYRIVDDTLTLILKDDSSMEFKAQ